MTLETQLDPALSARLIDTARSFAVPGMAIALHAPGRRAVLVHGQSSERSSSAVTAQTWFSVASLGKHVTAFGVLRLVQQGRIALDQPIGRYLSDVPAAWAGRSVDSLLHHTSGLPEYLSYTPADAVPEDRAGFMRAYGSLEPVFDEGQGWIYTNTNYILLGMLIAEVAGTSYAAALQALFDQTGCVGATVASPDWARHANAEGLGPAGRDDASARRAVIGDGDIAFTAQGALAWLGVLLADAGLDASRRAALFAPALLQSGRPSPYGCGWFVEHFGGQPLAHHAGHFDGWTAMAILAPASGSGVIAMCNLAPGNTRAMRAMAQLALEGFSPGSTPLGLRPMDDDDPSLTALARTKLLRPPGDDLDPAAFADELKRVAARGGPVRNVINLWAGEPPQRFELVQQQIESSHRLRRYRITYPGRIEHLVVGTTPERLIYWAWPL
jgi:CubicO group peptidase (beta-lactamase class C family)